MPEPSVRSAAAVPKTPVVGIVGGVGTLATLDFLKRLARLANARRDQDHIPFVVSSRPDTPDRNRSISGDGPSCAPALCDSAWALARAGADYLVVVCNAAHYYEEEVRAAAGLPLVSIIEEAAKRCAQRFGEGASIGIVCAEGSYRTKLFETALERNGLTALRLREDEQARAMALIYRLKGGARSSAEAQDLDQLVAALTSRGAQAVILGCTELPLAGAAETLPFIDPTEVLAERCVAIARSGRLDIISE